MIIAYCCVCRRCKPVSKVLVLFVISGAGLCYKVCSFTKPAWTYFLVCALPRSFRLSLLIYAIVKLLSPQVSKRTGVSPSQWSLFWHKKRHLCMVDCYLSLGDTINLVNGLLEQNPPACGLQAIVILSLKRNRAWTLHVFCYECCLCSNHFVATAIVNSIEDLVLQPRLSTMPVQAHAIDRLHASHESEICVLSFPSVTLRHESWMQVCVCVCGARSHLYTRLASKHAWVVPLISWGCNV